MFNCFAQRYFILARLEDGSAELQIYTKASPSAWGNIPLGVSVMDSLHFPKLMVLHFSDLATTSYPDGPLRFYRTDSRQKENR